MTDHVPRILQISGGKSRNLIDKKFLKLNKKKEKK